MLDLDARCPKCGDKLLGANKRCTRCHAVVRPKHGAYVPIRTAFAVIVVVLAAVGAALAWPAEIRAQLASLRNARVADGPGRPAWAYGGAEPASRVWASPLEPSLLTVCGETHARLVGPKYMSAFLAHRLLAAERVEAAAAQRPARWRSLSPEEDQDAKSSVGGVEAFTAACLRWSYSAVEPCASHAGHLRGPAAEACLLPPVQQALTLEPWLLCARTARIELVRHTCGEVAAYFRQQGTQAARTEADAKKSAPQGGTPGA